MKHAKKTQGFLTFTAAIALLTATPDHAAAGMEPFIGEISYVAFNFAPNGWFQCAMLGGGSGGTGSTV